jgi:hypothetical protein
MRKVIITIGVLGLLAGGRASAINFYSDGNIVTGDLWDTVYIYDTPPSHTTVNMSGGEVFGGAYSYNASTLNLSGGWVNAMSTYDESVLNMTGGNLNTLYSFEFSTANISGNEPGSPLDIYARDSSIINFLGTADAMELQAYNAAKINITGGTIEDLTVSNSGVINIYAGDILDALARDSAVINIFGHDLVKFPSGGAFGYGFVQGYYNDNSAFSFSFRGSETYSQVNLIPEPATILLLVAGGLFLRKKD